MLSVSVEWSSTGPHLHWPSPTLAVAAASYPRLLAFFPLVLQLMSGHHFIIGVTSLACYLRLEILLQSLDGRPPPLAMVVQAASVPCSWWCRTSGWQAGCYCTSGRQAGCYRTSGRVLLYLRQGVVVPQAGRECFIVPRTGCYCTSGRHRGCYCTSGRQRVLLYLWQVGRVLSYLWRCYRTSVRQGGWYCTLGMMLLYLWQAGRVLPYLWQARIYRTPGRHYSIA